MRLKERERERESGMQIVKKIGRDREKERVMYADEFFQRVSDREVDRDNSIDREDKTRWTEIECDCNVSGKTSVAAKPLSEEKFMISGGSYSNRRFKR